MYEDDQILEMIRSGAQRERGFKILMSKYQESMYQHVRRIVTHHEDTADVLQNVWIKVLRAIAGFKSESSLYTWIYRICTNEALTHLRKQKRRTAQGLDDSPIAVVKQEAGKDVDSQHIQNQLRRAITQLPEKQKLVFCLRYFDEMNYKDMADVLGTSVGGLKASYHHAVKKIEAFIKGGQ